MNLYDFYNRDSRQNNRASADPWLVVTGYPIPMHAKRKEQTFLFCSLLFTATFDKTFLPPTEWVSYVVDFCIISVYNRTTLASAIIWKRFQSITIIP